MLTKDENELFMRVGPGTPMGNVMRTDFTDKLVPGQIQPWIDITARYAKFPAFPTAEPVYVPAR
jgi:hypothetical protein